MTTSQQQFNGLPRSTAEAQGIGSAALLAFLDAAERADLGCTV